MLKTIRSLAALFGIVVLGAGPPGLSAAAEASSNAGQTQVEPWRAVVSDYENAPSFLIAVDKQAQELTAFERQSPMRVYAKYPIASGKASGDKLREGDHKTPEGVYFVTGHIISGLDYTLYGKEAYPVNYPNPVDRLRRKTGGGIWLHGKGAPLAPRDTRGCVAMNNEDIAALGRRIAIGQPVALASSLTRQADVSGERAAEAARLEALVHGWAKAWSDRSLRLFDYYDPEAYTRSGSGDFRAFRAQKERLFKSLAWIRTSATDVQILEGPGYWVTWFNQDYRASNLSTSGTRRLYWQKDAGGDFRIVGMEWLPGLKSPVLLASLDKPALPELAGEPLALNPPSAATAPAKPGGAKADAGDKLASAPLKAGTGSGNASAPPPPSTAAAPAELPLLTAEIIPPASPRPAAENLTPPGASVQEHGDAAAEALQILEQWRTAWESGVIENYARFYAPDAKQGGRSLKQVLAQKRHSWGTARPHSVVIEDIALAETRNGYKARFLQTYTNTVGYSDKGVKTLVMERRGGSLRIVSEDWTPITNR